MHNLEVNFGGIWGGGGGAEFRDVDIPHMFKVYGLVDAGGICGRGCWGYMRT